MIEPGLFVGTLHHRRLTPVAHAFRYGLFMVLLDIGRIPEQMRLSRLTSLNRWNWASYDDRDHTGDPARPLRERLALDAARTKNAAFVSLPAGESFETVLVTGKPWNAYNWYLGNFKSRIELNTDLPTELNGLFGTMCHEGYPGHHVYNALLEDRLVKRQGFIEFTVYPLYSPQSLLAEGTANVGLDILFTDDERRQVLTEVLGPAAGVPAEAILALDRIRVASKPLKYVNGEAARMLLDDGAPEADVVAFMSRWGLVTLRATRSRATAARSS